MVGPAIEDEKLAAMSNSRVRSAFSGRTAWARSLQAPLRDFLTTETGSASVLLAAAVAALAWANLDLSSYESVWHTQLSIRVGGSGISQNLRDWVNSGLMTFFFFVVGLEVRREFDVGELRERRRLALPVLAALGGMAVPVAIYLAINGGGDAAHGWGVAMSTDTAFALGMLALVGPRCPTQLRVFLLSLSVVDDIGALSAIAVASPLPSLSSSRVCACVRAASRSPVRRWGRPSRRRTPARPSSCGRCRRFPSSGCARRAFWRSC